ncbi:MAG: TetR/AcrR family transcriptional regulator [Acidimicrobiales bacterium]
MQEPTLPRRRLSADERRASIVEAATAVFSEAGYQRGTMAEVARRVGVSEPVVFQNFGSKAAVFAAALGHAAATVSQTMQEQAAASASVGVWLRGFLDPRHVRRLHARGSVGVLFADAMSVTDPRVADAGRRAHRLVARTLTDLIGRGQEDGSVRRDIDAETAAWWVLSLLASMGFRAAAVSHRERVEAHLAAMTLEMLTVTSVCSAPLGPTDPSSAK